ncbi:MAG: chromate resistance protein, partial [Kiritimatiellae bacterium]|nr:chromate resistance protein [Kiritimatiellia bacterium]
QVDTIAAETGATPYDIKGAELGHHSDECSFDAFIRKYELRDPALDKLALIVRAADTGRPDLAPEARGLLALSAGLSLNYGDDHEMLKHGMVMYDALYAFCADTPLRKLGRLVQKVVS